MSSALRSGYLQDGSDVEAAVGVVVEEVVVVELVVEVQEGETTRRRKHETESRRPRLMSAAV